MDLEMDCKSTNKYVSFELNSENYCVKITSVRSVLELPSCVHVPNVKSFVKGVINLRGVILTVIDGRDFILGHPIVLSRSSKVLVFEDTYSETSIGIIVDSVSMVLDICDEDIVPFVKKGSRNDSVVRGLCYKKNELFIILNEIDLFRNRGV
jgi:purine-binding chemotaxis protein CheW